MSAYFFIFAVVSNVTQSVAHEASNRFRNVLLNLKL